MLKKKTFKTFHNFTFSSFLSYACFYNAYYFEVWLNWYIEKLEIFKIIYIINTLLEKITTKRKQKQTDIQLISHHSKTSKISRYSFNTLLSQIAWLS